MGYRPRSGLWQRKSGKHGRKIRRPPPCTEIKAKAEIPKKAPLVKLTLNEGVIHCVFKPKPNTY